MTTNLATILATKIRTALEVERDAEAHTLATIGVLVNQAGLSLTPLPEATPEATPAAERGSDTQRHPSGVAVTADGWRVHVDGEWAGLIARSDAGHVAYFAGGKATLDSLDAAVSHLVAQQRTPSPERSIERGRDDAEEDSRREDEAVQS